MLTKGLRAIQNMVRGFSPAGKKDIEEKRQGLIKLVDLGVVTEDLLGSKVWRELLDPWIEGEKSNSRIALENHNSRYQKDEYGFYPTGRIHVLTEFKVFLKSTIEKAQTARKELALLYNEPKEQDNAPGR